MAISDWQFRWDALRLACQSRKATGRWAEGSGQLPRFDIAPPATKDAVVAKERELGCANPSSLRRVFLECSARVGVEWALPAGTVLPKPFRQIFAGECRWDLAGLSDRQATYRGWVENCFNDPENEYNRVWHGKFPVLEIGNGDMLGIDPNTTEGQPVVFLSHDGGEHHGYWLGRDFEDYVDRLTLLGCVGSEDWQLRRFCPGRGHFWRPTVRTQGYGGSGSA